MWTLETTSPIPHWRPRERRRDAVLVFTTRRGGVSRAPFDTLNLGRSTEDDAAAVRENRERLLRLATLDPDRLATAGQVHGARVVEVVAPGHHADCDALVTRRPDVVLAVTTADCMSLLYQPPASWPPHTRAGAAPPRRCRWPRSTRCAGSPAARPTP
jgi:copper oxidase (laccase) domain-containing protein